MFHCFIFSFAFLRMLSLILMTHNHFITLSNLHINSISLTLEGHLKDKVSSHFTRE